MIVIPLTLIAFAFPAFAFTKFPTRPDKSTVTSLASPLTKELESNEAVPLNVAVVVPS